MNKELLEKYCPNLIKYYEEGKCCSGILKLRKEIDILNKENKRLNNIINELEKELREGSFDVYFCSTNTQKTFKSNEIIIKSLILDKLKELKEE